MRKLDPKIVEAANFDTCNDLYGVDAPYIRARRVLRASSENVPGAVVEAAITALEPALDESMMNDHAKDTYLIVRAAISAGLAKWAEEE